MYKYYQVTALDNGQKLALYGSYDKADCVDEIDSEKHTWKQENLKQIKIQCILVDTPADPKTYGEK